MTTTTKLHSELARDIYLAKDNDWVHGYRKIGDYEQGCYSEQDYMVTKHVIVYIDPTDDKHWAFNYSTRSSGYSPDFPWDVVAPASMVGVAVYRVEPFMQQCTEWRRVTD